MEQKESVKKEKKKKDKSADKDDKGKDDSSTSDKTPRSTPRSSNGGNSAVPEKLWDPLAALDELQKQNFNLLRQKLQSSLTTDEQKRWANDAELVRFLRARDFDVAKAEALLKGALEWRFNTYKPHMIDPGAIAEEYRTGKNYVSKQRDKLGRPILYMKPRYENTKNYTDQVKLLVHNMERTIDHMDASRGVQQWVWIIDYNGFSMSNAPPLSVSKETLNLLSNQYPERLGIAFCVDPPFYFSMFWAAIYPFIPPATQKKVVFVKGSIEQKRKIFSEYIDLDQLESDYGGTVQFTWDFDKHRESEINVWNEKQKQRAAAAATSGAKS